MSILGQLNLVINSDGRILTDLGPKTEEGVMEIIERLDLLIVDDCELGAKVGETLHLLERGGEYYTKRGFKRANGIGEMAREMAYKYKEQKEQRALCPCE